MTVLFIGAMTIVAVTGLLVVLSRDPKRQVFAMAGNGLGLSLLFFVLQAPDVALSELAVNAVVTPLLFVATLAAIAMNEARR